MAIKIENSDAILYHSDELYHHGIKGQKWGVRNGPPYPLSRKKNRVGATRRTLSDETASTLLGVGTIVTASLLFNAIRSIRKRTAITKEEREFKKTYEKYSNDKKYADERRDEEIDPKTGLYLKKRDMTMDEDMERINPNYDKGGPFATNCAMCTAAMELRQRGYDVHAGKTSLRNKNGMDEADVKKLFSGGENAYHRTDLTFDLDKFMNDSDYAIKRYKKYVDSTKTNIEKQGDGARGEIVVSFSSGTMHSMYYTVEKGKTVLYDTQSKKKYTGDQVDAVLVTTYNNSVKRLDNRQMNLEYMKKHDIIC